MMTCFVARLLTCFWQISASGIQPGDLHLKLIISQHNDFLVWLCASSYTHYTLKMLTPFEEEVSLFYPLLRVNWGTVIEAGYWASLWLLLSMFITVKLFLMNLISLSSLSHINSRNRLTAELLRSSPTLPSLHQSMLQQIKKILNRNMKMKYSDIKKVCVLSHWQLRRSDYPSSSLLHHPPHISTKLNRWCFFQSLKSLQHAKQID